MSRGLCAGSRRVQASYTVFGASKILEGFVVFFLKPPHSMNYLGKDTSLVEP